MLDFISTLADDIGAIAPDKDSFIEKIFPSGIEPFIVQLLAMAVLITAFFVFLFKPVRKILDARKDKMMSEITEAEKKNANATILLSEAEARIRDSKSQASEIIAAAQKEAEILKEQTTEKTKAEVSRLKKEAEKDIEMSRKQAQDDINRSIVDVALKASEKVLGREVNADDNRRLLDDFLNGIGD